MSVEEQDPACGFLVGAQRVVSNRKGHVIRCCSIVCALAAAYRRKGAQ
jgi:hypothetical protein